MHANVALEFEVVTEADAESKPDYARMAADVALSLQTRTHAAQLAAAAERHREREAALSALHAHELTKLSERVAELETRLLTWQLTCAVLLALITTYLIFQTTSSLIATRTMRSGQRGLMLFLPLLFVGLVARFPAGLAVYWITTSLWSLGQQLCLWRVAPAAAVPLAAPEPPPDPPRPPARPRARQTRKRKHGRRR